MMSEPDEITCTRCGTKCCDFRQRDAERVCILCVEAELTSARAELGELRAQLEEERKEHRAEMRQAERDARDAAAEATWRERLGDDYGSY